MATKAKAKEIDDRLTQYISTTLGSLIKQSELAGDPAYLKRFPPSQIAALHGVMADKVARLVEACRADPVANPAQETKE